ncbi:hypothetical protein GRF59_22280 [Paenibacillus sp. HJL G12]|uniref:Uncharacterized protein n=1 Tax=Paenibacillus dendrobii TaxID=2691084 RepID=A0A7X3IN36_9BACL|nr:hypothetical protein [Paenibacillus dendrobii]MWV46336.1 hypothetical protein [Paenibacillus dendrobii]
MIENTRMRDLRLLWITAGFVFIAVNLLLLSFILISGYLFDSIITKTMGVAIIWGVIILYLKVTTRQIPCKMQINNRYYVTLLNSGCYIKCTKIEVLKRQLKSGFLALFSVILLLGFNLSAFAADERTTTENSKDEGTTVVTGGYITHLTPSQAEEYEKNLVFGESRLVEGTIPGITTFDAVVSLQWEKLNQYDLVSAYNTLTVNKTSTINVTLVQWADSFTSLRSPEMTYGLMSADYQTNRSIAGKYDNTNATIQFFNVPPGEYRLSAYNASSYTVSGNCYAKRDQGAN